MLGEATAIAVAAAVGLDVGYELRPRASHRSRQATQWESERQQEQERRWSKCTKAKSLLERGHNEVAPLALSMVELHRSMYMTHGVNGSLTALR